MTPLIDPNITNLEDSGFSLIELAVVLIIIGVLLYTALAVGVAQLEAGKIKATNEKLDKIESALAAYYRTYSATSPLPCPADPDIAITSPGATGFGIGQKSGDIAGVGNAICGNVYNNAAVTIYVGVVPVRDLNLPDDYMFDAWGRRITYVISKNCLDKDNWAATNVYKCSTATTTANGGVLTITGLNSSTNWSALSTYVLISHGKNGIGAFPRAGGAKIAGSASTSAAERANGNLNASGVALGAAAQLAIYHDRPINDSTTAANYFDDIMRWKTAPQIYYDANH